MRVLALDVGDKRIGVAISDPSGTIANPLPLIEHLSRPIDAAAIAQVARDNNAGLIIVGQSLDLEGKPNLEGRRAARLAAAIRTQTDVEVFLWDEFLSTNEAARARRALNVSSRRKDQTLDSLAATVILQSYLDANRTE